jgi:4-diphosphocytidyl-2-C-methyl-D-erythritol kinase
MGELRVQCPAKLNLFLEVVRRRPDGYHDLDTIMQAVDLFDDLHVAPRDGDELTLECSDPRLPTDGRNLVLQAALALREHAGHRGGARFRLVKRIPSEAGLGGGSSDAAGTLLALNALWGLGLSTAELMQVAAAVGSDVAFFLPGGTAHCTGRGEVVEPLGPVGAFHYVLVCPPVRVSTPEAYRRLRFPLTPCGATATMLRQPLLGGDPGALGPCLFNRLEGPASEMEPSLADAKARLAATGAFAGVLLTGSGSALFGLCRPEDWAAAVERTATLGLGETHAIRSLNHGVRLARRA